ncbi:MAG: orotidine 5'-phosphate decarboxylase [Desulfurococcales archaeon]|nr:orotidine 5'-phosphate decarboxylase [Desulfurococcales archaeon]
MARVDVPGRLGERLSRRGRLLQVALDFTGLGEAFGVALALPRGGDRLILEAGTPLIKSAGMTSVRILRALPGSHLVVADTKTADTGALEVGLAAEAGADAATVLACAPRETIEEAVREAERRGVAVYADMIATHDPAREAERLRELGVHIALLHIGIDTQRRLGITAAQLPQLIARVAGEFKGPIAVAGGVKPADVPKLVEAGASIIIIGSAITKAEDPARATREALEALESKSSTHHRGPGHPGGLSGSR